LLTGPKYFHGLAEAEEDVSSPLLAVPAAVATPIRRIAVPAVSSSKQQPATHHVSNDTADAKHCTTTAGGGDSGQTCAHGMLCDAFGGCATCGAYRSESGALRLPGYGGEWDDIGPIEQIGSKTARGLTAGPSILRSGVASQRGLAVSAFEACAEINTFPVATPMRKYTHRSHHWKDPPAWHLKLRESRARDASFNCAQRICSAMSLSGLFGNPFVEGWPVDWSAGFAWIGVPPIGGIIDEDFLSGKQDSYQQVPRNVGIDILFAVWDKFQHFGDVPSDIEVRTAAALATTSGTLCVDKVGHDEVLHDYAKVVYHHAEGDPGEPARIIAAPAKPTPTNDRVPVAVDSWLMDSGTPLDIVNITSIAGHKDKVRDIDRIVIDTANGHSVADKGIELVVELLGQRILPYVLDSSPNVLSLGRRCVVDGYGWYWPPYSLSPYLIHPLTG